MQMHLEHTQQLQDKEKELGFLNSLVRTMNEPTEIRRNRMITKGGVVKDLRNISKEVKQY
mgnify:FL=1|jgi:hypothetical protein